MLSFVLQPRYEDDAADRKRPILASLVSPGRESNPGLPIP